MRILIIGAGCIGLAALHSCGVRHKEVSRQLEEIKYNEKLLKDQQQLKLVTELFNDSLKGVFQVADTSGTDSTEVESNGIKVKIKVTGGKPGTKVNFHAIAKPVARSTLTAEASRTAEEKRGSRKVTQEQVNKSVNRLSGWVWFAIVLIIVGIAAIKITTAKQRK